MSLNPFSRAPTNPRALKRKRARRLELEQLESRIVPAYASAIQGDSPVAYWRLDEGSGALVAQNLGSLGSAADGLYIGAPAMAAAGAFGGNTSVAFNKPDDSIFD